MTAQTRESWLLALVEELRPWFHGELPESVLVSIGFSSKGRRSPAIGECWQPTEGATRGPHIFIHPKLTDPVEVAATLAHELVHASGRTGHGAAFRALAEEVGLEGDMRRSVPSEWFRERIQGPLERVGPLPHEAIGLGQPSVPKQGTRMVKLVAEGCCGYLVRTTRKWIEEGRPMCPHGVEMEEEVA